MKGSRILTMLGFILHLQHDHKILLHAGSRYLIIVFLDSLFPKMELVNRYNILPNFICVKNRE